VEDQLVREIKTLLSEHCNTRCTEKFVEDKEYVEYKETTKEKLAGFANKGLMTGLITLVSIMLVSLLGSGILGNMAVNSLEKQMVGFQTKQATVMENQKAIQAALKDIERLLITSGRP